MSLLIVGTVAYDTVETPFGKVKDALGGSATYAGCAASFFTPVNLVSVVGQDFKKEDLKFLAARKIDLSGVTVARGKTFRWSGLYEFDLNQAKTRFTQLNVLAGFKSVLPPNYLNSDFVFLANLDPVMQRKVIEQLKKPRLILLDTMNFWIENSKKELLKTIKMVDGLILNETEARELTGIASLIKAGRNLLKLGPKLIIIKKGEHGALLFTRDDFFAAPSYPLEEIKDPTGAGDTFAGGLAGYLAKTKNISVPNLRKAIILGSTLASFNVEDFSLNRLKKLKISEICRRFEKFQELVYFEELDL